MRIEGTSFGSITVDGKTYHHDIWVFADGGLRRRDRNHEFTLDEFYELLRGEPEVLVVGTGQAGCVGIEKAVVREAERRGIEFVSAETPRAVSLFNEAVKSGRRVAAAFHTTC
jgi:hypothetical protein